LMCFVQERFTRIKKPRTIIYWKNIALIRGIHAVSEGTITFSLPSHALN
jgi:hypothetical protein